jgi:hypothetical protein
MSLIGTVIAEELHTPDLIRLFGERIVAPKPEFRTAELKA